MFARNSRACDGSRDSATPAELGAAFPNRREVFGRGNLGNLGNLVQGRWLNYLRLQKATTGCPACSPGSPAPPLVSSPRRERVGLPVQPRGHHLDLIAVEDLVTVV